MSTLVAQPAMTMWHREIVRFYRQRNRIIGALATPLVFWLLIGSGLGPSFRLPDTNMSYLEYFFPGTVVLIMLFTAIFSTISVIEDRREGILQSVMVSPAAPVSIALGKFLGGATLALLQGLLFCLLAPMAGIGISPAQWPLLLAVFFLVGLGMTGLGFLIAWPMESTQGFHAIMNVLLMPMWLMSGALFPAASGTWVYWAMAINPVTYAVAMIRRVLYPVDPGVMNLPGWGLSLAVFGGFTILTLWLSARMVKKYPGKL